MTDLTLAKVTRRQIRDIWPYEDSHFTKWLADNIDAVGEAIGIELKNPQREVAAGTFRLDLLAEDGDANKVIIENQFGRSDHDHLGKMITYLTALEATSAVWIVETARPEHVNAVRWLNEASSGSFYLLKVEAISVGDSAAGPLLTLLVGPSDESRDVGTIKRDWAERHHLRHDFWTMLLERAKSVLPLHAGRAPGTSPYITAPSKARGLVFAYGARQHDTHAELYIDRRDEAVNEQIFEQLKASRQTIEQAFGGQLEWDTMPGKRAFRVIHRMNNGGYRESRESWPAIMDEMIDAMARLHRAVDTALSSLGT